MSLLLYLKLVIAIGVATVVAVAVGGAVFAFLEWGWP